MAIDVASQTDWNNAVAAVAAAGSGSTVTINVTAGFTLTSSLAALQAGAANVTVNITGNNQAINGAATYQGIQVSGTNAPTVNISSLAITNTAARGGNGENGRNGYYTGELAYGSGGGGGGGMGAGGGLLVGSGANVTLAAVTFTGNTATGGSGGNGGVAQNVAVDPVNGGRGGAGGVLNNAGVVGGGGAGGTGGTAGGQGTAGSNGTNIGDGGGGGGGSGTLNSTSYTTNNPGGNGNAGGGSGRPGGDGVTNNNGSQGPGSDGGSGGNGGNAQGGAVYVAVGGTLTILDSPISGAAVTGGAGGSNGVGQGPSSINGAPGLTGGAQGAGIFLGGAMANIGVSSGTLSYGNTIGGTGFLSGGITTALNKTGAGTLVLAATNTFTGNINISGGTVSVGSQSNLGSGSKSVVMSDGTALAVTSTATFTSALTFKIAGNAGFDIAAGTTTTLQGVISNGVSAGNLVKTDAGTLVLAGLNTYTGGTTVNAGTLRLTGAGTLGATTATLAVAGGVLDLGASAQTTGALTLTGGAIQNGTLTSSAFNTQAGAISAVLAGSAALVQSGSGTTTLSGANTYTGGTTVSGGTLMLSGAGTLGAPTGATTVSGGILDLGGTTQTQSAFSLKGGTLQNGALNAPISSTGGTLDGIGGTASITTTAGTTIIAGTSGYTGATTVNGGTLQVDGIITGTSSVAVNAGGILTGIGIIDPLTVSINNGSIFLPGNGTPGTSLAIVGNLAFQSGAQYVVALNPTTSSFATVSGTATLGGATVSAIYANGSYVSKQYTILNATGGVSGTFGSLVNTNLPSNFTASLSYGANTANLDLILNFTPSSTPNFGSGLNINQTNVANTLVNYFNTTGGIPLVYGALTPAGLTQASGESATGSQQTTFDAMNLFIGLLTDPFVAGRGDTASAGGNPAGYADEAMAYAAGKGRSKTERDAYATMYSKAPTAPAFAQRWSVWAAGYGGSQTTSGNAVVGSNDTRSSVYGTAVGADYRFSPDTIAGFALAGGGTSFSVNGLGTGRSDLFQAGAFIRHNIGAAYLSGAVAYGWQDITTDRTVTAGGIDRLRAEFNVNTWSGRVEGGYRYVAPAFGGLGLTPYAAGQFTTFDLPAYAESVVSGLPTFALNYAAKSVTDTRSELGLRTDKSYAVQDGVLTLRGRFAWAHDFNPDRSIGATFQALPGTSFVVNGAARASDSALTTAAVEMKWLNGWSAAATFEGEFSNVTNSYAGKGVVRYAW